MSSFETFTINYHSTIIEALNKLNNSKTNQTLFVTDNENKLIATLTDGDVRRALIRGYNLETEINNISNKKFEYISDTKDIEKIKQAREKGIKLIPVLNTDNSIASIINLKTHISSLPLDAVLMAGGKGERLRPLTEKKPKPLLSVGSKAIIDYNIDSLIKYGVRNINVTVNYLKEQIIEHFKEDREGIYINCIQEPTFLGTIGSVKFVDNFINDTVLIMNSDLFTNINFEDLYLSFQKNASDMSVVAVPYSVNIPYGIFNLEGRKILGIKEKPSYNYYANAGIYLVKKELLELIPDNTYFNATDFIELLISKKKIVTRYPLSGYWIDIGKHEDYIKAQEIAKHL